MAAGARYTATEPNAELDDKNIPSSSVQLQMQILNQLQTLVELQSQAETNAPTVYDALYNVLLQFVGLASAAVFGAFSILAWQLAHAGNSLASQANELSITGNCVAKFANLVGILDFCRSNEDLAIEACTTLTSGLAQSPAANSRVLATLNKIASQAVGDVERCFTSDTGTPVSASHNDNVVLVIIGAIGLRALLLGAILGLRFMSHREKKRRMISKQAKCVTSLKEEHL